MNPELNYKKSNYNVVIETLQDNSHLMYNTYTGIFGIMDTKTQAILDNIENFDVSCDDEETLSAVTSWPEPDILWTQIKTNWLSLKLREPSSDTITPA